MFYVSKLLTFATQPLAWAAILIAVGIVLMGRWPRVARSATGCGLAAGIIVGWQPLPDAVLRHLEAPYMHPAGPLDRFDGVVVLGGALSPGYVWTERTDMALDEAAERMAVSAAIARRYPTLKVVFAGGEGELWPGGMTEAQRAERFYQFMGLAPGRIIYENKSRTTRENAQLTARLPGVDPSGRWLVLTSAWHMRRSLLAFEQAGWKDVTPYPVDFRTGSYTPWVRYSIVEGANAWQIALHELVGYVAYQLFPSGSK